MIFLCHAAIMQLQMLSISADVECFQSLHWDIKQDVYFTYTIVVLVHHVGWVTILLF